MGVSEMTITKGVAQILRRIITISIIFTLVLSGCSTNKVDKKDEDISASLNSNIDLYQPAPIYNAELSDLLNDENISDDYKQLLNVPDDYEPLDETTYDKLHDAFNKELISEEEYSKLLILLQHKSELIPEQYIGAEGNESINYAYQYISENWNALSEDTKKLVAPYMLPIDNPESYYYYTNEEEIQLVNSKSSGLLLPVYAAGESKQLVVHEFNVDNQKVIIQYYEYDSWSKDKKLEYNMCINDIEESITHSYYEFENLLAVSLTKPVRIEVVQLVNGRNGEAWFQNGEYRIRLAKANYEDATKTKGVAAHELFHNFQYEMGLRFQGVDMKWLHEATAKWSEHYAFDAYNTEHGYLDYFFRSLDRDRVNFGKNFEYSGYMMFYYFSDYGQYNIVPDILWGTVRNGENYIREYLTSMIDNMKNQYGDYAFINLNSAISKVYDDYGPLPGCPSGKAYARKVMKVDQEDIKDVSLNPGALQYYFYVFDSDEEIKHVGFEFDKTFDEDKYIKRQAIVKIDGKWSLEDWSSLENIKYCKQNESNNENIQAVLLIYSNSNFKKDGISNPVDKFKVTTGKCYSEMDISIKAEYEYMNEDFIWTSVASLEDKAKIIDHTFYISKDCVYKMEGKGILEGKIIIETTGSYSGMVNDPTIDNSMTRLIMPIEDDSGEIKNELKKFGIQENTPKGGILITLPSIQENEDLSGTTTFYMPEPAGVIPMDMPLPYDGLSQIIAVDIDKNSWNPKGFKASMTIDQFSHKPPLMDWFKVDFSQLQDMLASMNVTGGADMQDLNQIIADSGINMEELGDIDGLLPGTKMEGGNNSLNNTIDAIMMLTKQSTGNGATGVIKLTVTGEYTKNN